MSLLSRLGRVLKAEMGRRLPNVDPEVPWYETPKGARYGGAQTGGAQTGGAQTGAANESDTNESHVNEHHVDARIAGYYAALELPIGADITAVKQAHRRLMKRYHPDRFHSEPDKAETANELTRRLNEAYDGLRQYLEAGA
jgi:hypothetical protein